MGCTPVRHAANAHTHQGIKISDWKLLHLFIEFLDESRPVLQTNLENFPVINLAYTDEIKMRMCKIIPVGQFLNDLASGIVSFTISRTPNNQNIH